ncbi:NAD-dependent epimerase/dehydratase family protein [Kutzneria sp. NPDC052558]|uniref:NAD-dependent epimerase/dehydratase family protein n=1 Tax=Kutzneria sp. NPDC052558 TaxID=3364121 RepID=UPI0037CBCCB3
MILITGGLGFIGSHTARALTSLGQSCVLAQRRAPDGPSDLGEVVHVDITDLAALRAVGDRHKITDIVHLAGSMPWPPTQDAPIEASRRALGGLFNVLQVAQDWGVSRVGLASTIGIYGGVVSDQPLTEDLPLPLPSPHVIPTFKKISELLAGHLADAAGLDIVNYRIGAIWGPLGRPVSPFFAAPQLVHAAASGAPFETADDAIDLCYAKDCGRALALLQLADGLQHRTYNVSSGRLTSNADIVAALGPDARITLTPATDVPRPPLDITRLRADTGFSPAYDTDGAVADYLAWLRAGNPR